MSTRPAPRPGIASGGESASPVARTLGAGTRLGRYEILGPIAAGGMAEVWIAEQTGDLGFKKLVALKTIRAEFAFDASFRAMFLDEARLASRIRHGNVVEVLDLGVDGPTVFQVMTLIEGSSLSGWLKARGSIPRGIALRIVVDTLRGLQAAHELGDDDGEVLGLVHRDVSPQNVLVGIDGVSKLADFGIAKALGRGTADQTLDGEVKGKLGYVAPEIFLGMPASAQSDIFSVGVILWECLVGRRLFPVESGSAPASRRHARAADPRTLAPDLPTRLAEITMAALDADPFTRTKSANDMADALEATGLVASHKDVAQRLAADLGDAIRLRRDRARAGAAANDAPTETVAIVATLPIDAPRPASVPAPPLASDPRSKTASRAWLAGVIALVVVGLVVVAVRLGRTTPAPSVTSASSAPSAEDAVDAAPPKTETAVATAATETARIEAAKSARPEPTTKRRPAAPPHEGRPAHPPPPSSAPRPTFESPY